MSGPYAGSRTAGASAHAKEAPTASSTQVIGSSKNPAYDNVWTSRATNAARTAARAIHPAGGDDREDSPGRESPRSETGPAGHPPQSPLPSVTSATMIRAK